MKRYTPSHIRNVVLVGHSSAGKTTLAEALLHRAGVTTRMGRVDQGTTVCDYDPEEQRRGLSLSLAMAPFEWKDHKINLIDTPGYADFVGDVIAALRVCDLAIFVVSAVEGVQVQTEAVWKIANKMGVPRMVFVNKLDLERADFQSTLAQLQARDLYSLGVEQESADWREEGGGVRFQHICEALQADHTHFADEWLLNILRQQGFPLPAQSAA